LELLLTLSLFTHFSHGGVRLVRQQHRVDTVVEQAACTLTTNNKAFCQFSFYFIYSIKGNNFNTMSEDGEPKPEVAEPITIRVRDQVRVVATIVFNSLHMIL
jgi:hypothetical protein